MTRIVYGLALFAISLNAQPQPLTSVLTIETDNVVTYVGDVFDPTRLALMATPQTPMQTRAFTETITVGDVRSINGRPAAGLWQTRSLSMGYSPTAGPGSAIADSAEGAPGECKWAILTPEGILVGRFQEGGLGTHQITGGSGIFLGIQGTQTTVQAAQTPRRTSMTEDPSLRRILGGGTLIHTFHIAATYPPAFVSATNGASIYHSDFSPVTAASPAHAGETLIAQVVNLGYTTPSVAPGAAFPSAGPLSVVNALVEAVVDVQATDAVAKVGWPGQTNVYRVDFQVPAAAGSGTLAVRIRAGGIAGPAIALPVQ